MLLTGNPFMDAATFGDVGGLRLLLRGRMWVDDADALKAFTMAVTNGQTEIVGIYLEEGIPLDRQDSSGHTPLTWAASGGRTNVVRQLLAAGADINLANHEGMTALHYAALRDDVPMVELLLARDASLTHLNCEGQTPLDMAWLRQFTIDGGSGVYCRKSEGRAGRLLRWAFERRK